MKKIIYAIVAVAFVVVGCSQNGQSIFDTPISREYKKDVVLVTWIEVSGQDELKKVCAGAGDPNRTLGCAVFNRVIDQCTIYTHKNPSIDVLGHEMLHCFAGRWHGV